MKLVKKTDLPELPALPKDWTVVEFLGSTVRTVVRGVDIAEAARLVGEARAEGRHLMTQRNEDRAAAEARQSKDAVA